MSTPAPLASNAQQAAYDQMTANIRKTIDDQNNIYNAIQQANDSSFSSNRKTYQIQQGVTDVKSQRDEIWQFLQDKYDENTKLRNFLFQKDLSNKVELDSQTKELDYLRNELNRSQTNFDTSARNIQNEMYNHNRYEYFFKLYHILFTTQIFIIIILLLVYYDIIPQFIGLLLVLGVLFIICLYIVYYVYYNNNNRNSFEWDNTIIKILVLV